MEWSFLVPGTIEFIPLFVAPYFCYTRLALALRYPPGNERSHGDRNSNKNPIHLAPGHGGVQNWEELCHAECSHPTDCKTPALSCSHGWGLAVCWMATFNRLQDPSFELLPRLRVRQ